jgi:hypothetical protein
MPIRRASKLAHPSLDAIAAEAGEPPEYLHVYPLFGREHVIKGLECWCHPVLDDEVPNVVVHNLVQ